MGHRHTSTQLGGHSEFFGAHRGSAEAASARGTAAASDRDVKLQGGAQESGLFGRFTKGALLGLVRVYQILLSPIFGGACKFYPSCSNYAFEAIQRHGALRGFALAMKRLGRCRPFTKGGYDPVPETKPEQMERATPSIEEPVQ
jgi:putative membrane protein insertion efficiency factor